MRLRWPTHSRRGRRGATAPGPPAPGVLRGKKTRQNAISTEGLTTSPGFSDPCLSAAGGAAMVDAQKQRPTPRTATPLKTTSGPSTTAHPQALDRGSPRRSPKRSPSRSAFRGPPKISDQPVEHARPAERSPHPLQEAAASKSAMCLPKPKNSPETLSRTRPVVVARLGPYLAANQPAGNDPTRVPAA